MERVILVNERDEELGAAEKLAVHRDGRLHRAISVFVTNSHGEWLLQRRHRDKYHSGGLWSNTCCSHPRPGEDTRMAARRRLAEEMGVICPLTKAFSFVYRHEFKNGLIEYEYDHVYVGRFDGDPAPDPEEVDMWKWIELPRLWQDLGDQPARYTYWFRACAPLVAEYHGDAEPVGRARHYAELAG